MTPLGKQLSKQGQIRVKGWWAQVWMYMGVCVEVWCARACTCSYLLSPQLHSQQQHLSADLPHLLRGEPLPPGHLTFKRFSSRTKLGSYPRYMGMWQGEIGEQIQCHLESLEIVWNVFPNPMSLALCVGNGSFTEIIEVSKAQSTNSG